MYVCICAQVRERELRGSIAAGAHDLAAVAKACGAGTGCGNCHDRVETIIEEVTNPLGTLAGLPMPRRRLLPVIA